MLAIGIVPAVWLVYATWRRTKPWDAGAWLMAAWCAWPAVVGLLALVLPKSRVLALWRRLPRLVLAFLGGSSVMLATLALIERESSPLGALWAVVAAFAAIGFALLGAAVFASKERVESILDKF